MVALTAEELMAWVEQTSTGWRELLDAHPEAMTLACDIRETSSVAQLLQHIVAVELRYAERLQGLPQTAYEAIPFGTTEEIFATHDRAMQMPRECIKTPGVDWEEPIELATRSLGTLRTTRRTILVHCLMHSIRHYAQLATIVRAAGIKPHWEMDYLMMGFLK